MSVTCYNTLANHDCDHTPVDGNITDLVMHGRHAARLAARSLYVQPVYVRQLLIGRLSRTM